MTPKFQCIQTFCILIILILLGDSQNIAFDGYINTLGINQSQTSDTVYYFDLNFENIDLWILPFLSPNVFSEMSGTATGVGKVWGSNSDYDFIINYSVGEVDPVFIRPRFWKPIIMLQVLLSFLAKTDCFSGLLYHGSIWRYS